MSKIREKFTKKLLWVVECRLDIGTARSICRYEFPTREESRKFKRSMSHMVKSSNVYISYSLHIKKACQLKDGSLYVGNKVYY